MGAADMNESERSPTKRVYHSHTRARSLFVPPAVQDTTVQFDITPLRRKSRRPFPPLFSVRALVLFAVFTSIFLILRYREIDPRRWHALVAPPHTLVPGRSFLANHRLHQLVLLSQPNDQPLHPEHLHQTHTHQNPPVSGDLQLPNHPPPQQQQPQHSTHNHPQVNSPDSPPASSASFPDPADLSTFDNRTTLNYFHMHKTGGVSFKDRIYKFFNDEQVVRVDGRAANIFDTCHESGQARDELGIEAQWSCDWEEIEGLSESERNHIDLILGHQYWERGAGFWVPNRDMRYFTVMRHPLHRKVSFFYHFFVRNSERAEDSVTADELIQFVLGKQMPDSPLTRDAGPGYFASRLWSDGLDGYDGNRFSMADDTANTMVSDSIRRMRRNFVFIGLQTQEPASLCMLKKTVEAFANAHEFENISRLEDIAKPLERMNTGSYALTGKILWDKMTHQQRKEFKRVERVDLGIYAESVRIFQEAARRFGCEGLILEDGDDSIAMQS